MNILSNGCLVVWVIISGEKKNGGNERLSRRISFYYFFFFFCKSLTPSAKGRKIACYCTGCPRAGLTGGVRSHLISKLLLKHKNLAD